MHVTMDASADGPDFRDPTNQPIEHGLYSN
jgi:hypothetical protein